MNNHTENTPGNHRLDAIETRLKFLEEKLARLAGESAPATAKPEQLEVREPEQPHPTTSRPPPLPHQATPRPEKAPSPSPSPTAVSAAPVAPIEARSDPVVEPKSGQPSRFAEALGQMGLRPPRSGGNLEVQVGTWWATRIGALLAVICVVFFGVYVSQNAAPIVRFLELLGAALGMTVLGLWLGRSYERFGGVLFAGGLALLYFTAYAAYGVQPVRIIQSEAVASWVQFGAVLGIVACGLWRRSSHIASMAIFFGYTASVFSFTAGLNEYALTSNFILAVGATALYLLKRWALPFQLAVVLTYIVFAIIVVFGWLRTSDIVFWRAMAHLLSYMLLFGVTDYMAMRRKALMHEGARKMVHIFSSSAAALLGYVITRELFPQELVTYYFLFGGVLLGGAVAYFLLGQPNALMHAYFIKGAGILTVGVAVYFGGWTRWVALAVQSGVLLASAKHSRLRVVEAAMGLVWLVSFYYFVENIDRSGYLNIAGELFRRDHLLATGYLLFSGMLFSLRGRWFDPPREADCHIGFRDIVNGFYAVLIGVVGVLVAAAFAPDNYFPITAAVIAVALALVAWPGRHWVPFAAGFLPLVAAHVVTWAMVIENDALRVLWNNGAVAVFVTLGLATYACLKGMSKNKNGLYVFVDDALHTLWIVTLLALYHESFSADGYALAAVVTSLAIALAAGRFPFRVLADVSLLPAVIAAAGIVYTWLDDGMFGNGLHMSPRMWIAAGVSILYACASAHQPWLHRSFRYAGRKDRYQWAQLGVVMVFVGHAITTTFTVSHVVPAMALFALVLLALARWPGLRPAVTAAEVYILAAVVCFMYFTFEDPVVMQLESVWPFILAAVLVVAHVVLLRHCAPGLDEQSGTALRWLNGTLALALLYVLFARQEGALANYTSVFWGLSAIALFLVGLLDRSKPLRLLGLIGLAVCIPRVFIVDMQSTLYRIAAFGVLGGVLLLVGFLYHRFRDLIEKMDER